MTDTSPVTFSFEGDAKYHLIGTYTRYSSWTARVVAVLEYFQIPYKSTNLNLHEISKLSQSGRVPILIPLSKDLKGIEINDSLSICEFFAESYPGLPLWPKDRRLRALARSAAAEMHSGFGEIRNTYHSNYLAKYTGNMVVDETARREIERILVLWGQAREVTIKTLQEYGEKDEGFLCGNFGIVDAFYWPVLWRFRSYNLPLITASPEALAWMKTMWSDPTLKALGKDCFKQAENPVTLTERYEDIFKGNPEIKFGQFEEDWEFRIG